MNQFTRIAVTILRVSFIRQNYFLVSQDSGNIRPHSGKQRSVYCQNTSNNLSLFFCVTELRFGVPRTLGHLGKSVPTIARKHQTNTQVWNRYTDQEYSRISRQCLSAFRALGARGYMLPRGLRNTVLRNLRSMLRRVLRGGVSIIGPHYSERQKHLMGRPKTKVLVCGSEQYRKVSLSYINANNSYSYDNSSQL